ncbi:MAG: serine/threonine protein kinase [Lachnospiraceae bacterium]|nr:serine/threonine protein kinase [Lachnospiraceae bacterium]
MNGTVLKERYLVGTVIGEGGFGITYVGRDLTLDMKVAIKEYYPFSVASRHNMVTMDVSVSEGDQSVVFEQGKAKFLEEARTLAKFAGEPNIVGVHDFFTENNTAYIVMEFLEGISLSQQLKDKGTMSFDEVFLMLKPVMEALDRVHRQGLIHRDISPSNLMLLTTSQVKLIDFGTTRGVNYSGENSLSVILKPSYVPEEQHWSHGLQGPWTDVYAMCATIYKLITGETPENAVNRLHEDSLKSPTEMGARISRAEEAVLLRGLAVRHEERIQSMSELCQQFQRAKDEIESDYSPAEDKERTEYIKRGADECTPGIAETEESTTYYASASRDEMNSDLLPEDDAQEEIPQYHAEDDEKKTGGKHPKRRKKKRKNKVARVVVGAVAAIFLVLFMLDRNAESPYKSSSGYYAEISDVTVDSSILDPISNDSNIIYLIFSDCEISDEMIQEISGMTQIMKVDFTRCTGFTTLAPLAEMESLRELLYTANFSEEKSFDGDAMFPVEFEQLTSLSVRYVSLTTGTGFLKNFTSLSTLDMKGTVGTDDFAEIACAETLTSLYLDETDAGSNDLSVFGSCTELVTFSACGSGLTTIAWMDGLTELADVEISDNQITTLEPLGDAAELYELYAENNLLSDLKGLEGHAELYELYLGGNQISDISALAECTELIRLLLQDNLVTDISSLENCTNLLELNLDDNDVADISALVACTKLMHLYIQNNKIENLDVCEQMIDLTELNAAGNQIRDISGLANVTMLETVYLYDNQITDISVLEKSTEKLKTVLLGNNQITDISALNGSTGLEVLGIENNQIASLNALAECDKLEYLCAYGNQITDISALSDCTALSYVDLGGNEISDITPLGSSGTSMKVLMLQNNRITDISSLNCDCSYDILSLYGNEIADYSVFESFAWDNTSIEFLMSYHESGNFSSISDSLKENEKYTHLYFVDTPLDQQAGIKEIFEESTRKTILWVTPKFVTSEEADVLIEEYREKEMAQYWEEL